MTPEPHLSGREDVALDRLADEAEGVPAVQAEHPDAAPDEAQAVLELHHRGLDRQLDLRPGYLRDLSTESGQTLQGSFSAVSKPNLTRK